MPLYRFQKSVVRMLVGVASMLVLWAGGSAPCAGEDRIELKLSHFSAATHGIQTDFIEPWARELAQRTNGRVQVKIFDGSTRLGSLATQYDQVLSGAVDIAHGMQDATPGRFPRTAIIEIPFLTENADVATRILWAMYPKQLKEEYAAVHVLALHAHNGGLIHTQQKKVVSMQDLKGMRLRSPSGAVNKMLTALGATALGMPLPQVAINLRGGLIDGALSSWDGARALKLEEITKYHFDARAYTLPYFFVMNRKKYQALPAEVRKAIDDISGNTLIANFGPWWSKWDQAGLTAAHQRGNVISTLSTTDRERWAAALAPAMEKYIAETQKLGVKNAPALYAEMKKLNKEYSKPRTPR